jgi:phosphatidylinositol alpha 1,6-mannosyltransferase
MRVLYCTDTYSPQVNGISVVTALSVSGLTRLGWECAVVAPRVPRGGDDSSNDNGGENTGAELVLSLPSIPFPGYSEMRLAVPSLGPVQELVNRFRPDLIHCATELTVGRMGQLAAAQAGIPLVSSYHTDFASCLEAQGKSWLRGTVSAYLARFHQRSRRSYTPSTVSRDDLVRLGVPDVEVWGRGVDTQRFHPRRRSPEARASLGLGDRFTFLYVGRLSRDKRVERVIQAYGLAQQMLPRDVIHLVVAGTGPQEAAFRARAPRGVTFLGFVDRVSRLPDLYANCDAFLFASTTDTLGLVVLEAMASGLPVIAAPAGGIRDHLRHDYNGLAYPAEDVGAMAQAIVHLAWEGGLARRLGKGARAAAEGLSWQREIERLDLSYREICELPVTEAAA